MLFQKWEGTKKRPHFGKIFLLMETRTFYDGEVLSSCFAFMQKKILYRWQLYGENTLSVLEHWVSMTINMTGFNRNENVP